MLTFHKVFLFKPKIDGITMRYSFSQTPSPTSSINYEIFALSLIAPSMTFFVHYEHMTQIELWRCG